MIDYASLRTPLLKLEGRVPGGSASGFVAAKRVRTRLSPVQAFALDTTTSGYELPVVVAVGANYTQGTVQCPRDRAAGHPAVEDDLSYCRARLRDALSRVDQRWVAMRKASHASLAAAHSENWHLVMANFCLWNTNERWQKIPVGDRTSLLANNPTFDGRSTGAPQWPHLNALAHAIAPEPILWVAHGIHSEVFGLFTSLRGLLTMSAWIMTPNISYRYFHYGRCYPR